MSYCRYNLLVRDLDVHLRPILERKGIGLLNASPLHMGILTERGAPGWHPAPESVREAGKRVLALARMRGMDAANAALRFCLDHPYVSSTFIGMSESRQVEANLRALEIQNDAEFLAEVELVIGAALNERWASGRLENQD